MRYQFKISTMGRNFVLLLLVGLMGCGQEPAKSLFDPNEPSRPTPVISSIVPPDSSLAGVGEIVVNGQNFSPKPEENFVFFNEVVATVLEASESRLKISSPKIVGDSIRIKIAVHGAELFSNPVYYKLVPAVSDFGKIFEGDVAYGIASDRDGNVFVFVQGRTRSIKKMAPDGTTTDFASTSFLRANAMKMGPNDLLYVAPSGRIKRIATFAADGTEGTFVSLGAPTLPEPRDLDFDSDGNLWVVGGSILFRITPDKSVTQAATFPVQLRTVRIFDNFVYVAGRNPATGEEKIWRSEIQGDTLKPAEVVLDVAAAAWLDGASVQTLTFSENGEMFLGVTAPATETPDANGLFVLRPDGSHDVWYPGLIAPEIYALSWGPGQSLFAVRQFENTDTNELNSQVYKIKMARSGAPYYGR